MDWKEIQTERAPELDIATPIGIAAAFGLMLTAIWLGSGLTLFLDLNSLMIVLGGTIGATLISFPLEDFRRSFAVVRTVFYPERVPSLLRVHQMIDVARRARGSAKLASLEAEVAIESDPFLRRGLELVADGLDPNTIRGVLTLELTALVDRHRRGAQLFQTMGSVAPAMGLIGTLIGLVQMLQQLNNPAEIGPAMSTALLTTFYGAVLSYIVLIPIAGKLRTRSQDEALLKEMTIEGLACIAEGINPRMIEQNLLGFLPPERRISQYD